MRALISRFRDVILGDPRDRILARFNRDHRCTVLSKATDLDLHCVQGEGVYIGEHAVIANGSIIRSHAWIGPHALINAADVGEYAAIAPGVCIGGADHDLDRVAMYASMYDDGFPRMYRRPCVIGPNVWLAAGSIIARGVNIGCGAVVGANSFVNQDVPPFAIVVGSPARIVKYRFSPETITKLLDSRWWEYGLSEAKIVVAKLETELMLARCAS